MKATDVIVIGAGISGLLVARQLSRAGRKVRILEARRQAGGRTHTIGRDGFPYDAEGGAEFIHGKLHETIRLLKEYKIDYTPAEGEIWHVHNGLFEQSDKFISAHESELKKKLDELKTDLPVQVFLDLHFPGAEYMQLHKEVKRFVEGYDGADVARASTFSLREELSDSEKWKLFRVHGGYGALVKALYRDCMKQGCRFHFLTPVDEIIWKRREVEVYATDGRNFFSDVAVITVPLGVLKAGTIRFSPPLLDKQSAVQQLGNGDVIKILMCFRDTFWASEKTKARIGQDLSKMFFLFSDAVVPTWWTQYPNRIPVLTGWLSGTAAQKRQYYTDEEIFKEAIGALSYIFKISEQNLWLSLRDRKIMHWARDPYAAGAYTYAVPDDHKFISMLERPVENTLFFAGELYAPEAGSGLVEAAIASAFKTTRQLLLRNAA